MENTISRASQFITKPPANTSEHTGWCEKEWGGGDNMVKDKDLLVCGLSLAGLPGGARCRLFEGSR